jgi:DNA-binding NarL/FixJ family response regulator
MKQKIVLADDHQLLLEGIKTVVEEIDDAEIIATVNSGTELLNFLHNHRADLVLLDLNMPGHDGLKCLHIIKQLYPSTKVLVLTSYDQPEPVDQVKKLNGNGYLVKNSSSLQLKEAVRTVLEGNTYYSQPEKAQKQLNGTSYFIDDFLKKFQLTKREVDIIRLVCSELSSKQIAAELFLSEFTVNTHRKNIFRKLNIKNVAGLVNFAKENGLLQ